MRMPYERGLTGATTLPDFAVDPYRTPCPAPPVGEQAVEHAAERAGEHADKPAGELPDRMADEGGTARGRNTEVDRNRLELHAVLTLAGVPPHPEDRRVIEHLAELGAVGVTTILRWLRQTGRAAPV